MGSRFACRWQLPERFGPLWMGRLIQQCLSFKREEHQIGFLFRIRRISSSHCTASGHVPLLTNKQFMSRFPNQKKEAALSSLITARSLLKKSSVMQGVSKCILGAFRDNGIPVHQGNAIVNF